MISIFLLYDHNHSLDKQFNLLLASWKNYSPYRFFSSTCFQQLSYINCWKPRWLLSIILNIVKKTNTLLYGSFYTRIMQSITERMPIMIRIWNCLLKHTTNVCRLFQTCICHQQKFPLKNQLSFYKRKDLQPKTNSCFLLIFPTSGNRQGAAD